MMNYLISAYSVNPYHGSEDGVGGIGFYNTKRIIK